MKKLLLISLAAFVLTNCAKESVVDSDLTKNGNTIGFTTYSNIPRGKPIGDNEAFKVNGNFGVTAFINGVLTSPYMGAADAGAKITYGTPTASKWDYDNPKDIRFWPTNGEMLNFYAYTPFENTNRIAAPAFTKTDGMIFASYKVNEAAFQDDFMYAAVPNAIKAIPAVAVPLTFCHAMTQILFKARMKADENLYVDIEADGIKLHNIKSMGNFTLQVDGVSAAWTGQMAPTAYTAPSRAVTVNGLTGTDTDIQNVFIADNVLMLLPQEFAAWNPEMHPTPDVEGQTGGYLSLSCKFYYKDGENIQYLFGTADAYGVINIPFSSQNLGDEIWKMQNRITYTLLIDGTLAGLEPIEFTTEVDGWVEANISL